MRIGDRQAKLLSALRHQFESVDLAITQSKTNRPYLIRRPGFPFEVTGLAVSNVAYTATIGIDLFLMGPDERISVAGLDIDAVAEKFKVGAHVIREGGKFQEKAVATALVFSAVHVITATKFGVILVQETDAGVISTKVPVSPQVYESAALALAALPAPDAGNIAIGYIAIEAGVADWDANTDDLTDASDVTTATFNDLAVTIASCLAASVAPVAFSRVAGTALTTAPAKDSAGTKDIVALVTTDGNAVITNGRLEVVWRGTR